MNYLLVVGQGSRLTCTSCMMYLLLQGVCVCFCLPSRLPTVRTAVLEPRGILCRQKKRMSVLVCPSPSAMIFVTKRLTPRSNKNQRVAASKQVARRKQASIKS